MHTYDLVVLGVEWGSGRRTGWLSNLHLGALDPTGEFGEPGGFVMVVFFSFWGRAFGDAHLGRIQGAAQVMTVLGSAVGPLALAWCVETTGSYAFAFYVLALVVAALGAAGVIVRLPRQV